MKKTGKNLTTAFAVVAVTTSLAMPAFADISDNVVKIGIMNDQSGPYADNCGPGAVAAARLAVEDAGGEINGAKIEIVVADDQNKPDIGAATALRWLDEEGVDAIVGCSTSSIANAVHDMMQDRKKPYMLAGTASSYFTNERCSPMTTQWVVDSYALPRATVNSLLSEGIDSWYFITVDYAFGKSWQEDTTTFIEEGGGEVLGSVLHPLGSNDFSSYLLRAQASGAKAIALANAGGDFANTMKQAAEFGVGADGQLLVPLGMFINSANGIGLDVLKDVRLTTAFYWDANDETRAFAKRYREAFNGRFPNGPQAGNYSAVAHYLKAVAATGSDDGEVVMAEMKDTPVNDFSMKDVSIRDDGQVMRPLYAARVKGPDESEYEYDYYEITDTIAPSDAWRPAEQSRCPLLTGG
ncbi:probable substrate-binding protein [Pseudooceanicola batsensis HTCC2597]|uniref:Probable substrate-binding protein n=1 Tax=Pseudooceanicola batsensis (strain ATCC BAA-863 / DSM 15984 / KCTC 12145 / HTCC2597) TaxID=252305 RepID=A3U161_PSEBH|nr:ABC transporter substrate-binding protein [Pseudooceanicola batsensis]EAQ02044.1 probable substrate-binding protein [Pseudooceanicola batsensis HTCC2597]